MIHYLRDGSNDTLVDIDATKDDIHCVVVIETYSKFLLSLSEDGRKQFILDMGNVQEIRGHYFESGYKGSPDDLARNWLTRLTRLWGLGYVTD